MSPEGDSRRQIIAAHAKHFRETMTEAGFTLVPGEHAIIPVMLHEARIAQAMAAELLEAGVLASGFSFPVVPKGQARIRTQMSAGLSTAQIDQAAASFKDVARKLEIIP